MAHHRPHARLVPRRTHRIPTGRAAFGPLPGSSVRARSGPAEEAFTT